MRDRNILPIPILGKAAVAVATETTTVIDEHAVKLLWQNQMVCSSVS